MTSPAPQRRVYPLTTSSDFTEEEIAVTFAMTSRRPEPFDEIAAQVTAQKAADFHEKWVLDYGHASVAEHAVVHLAIENISRLACDALEDNRLASYTEKSSRYQVIEDGFYHIPAEVRLDSRDREPHRRFIASTSTLFAAYADLVDRSIRHLTLTIPPRTDETPQAHRLRLRRTATDHCRAILPAATLTNVGLTANARTLEHLISKLLSHPLNEPRTLGKAITDQAQSVVPTLIKYAERNDHLVQRSNHRETARISSPLPPPSVPPTALLIYPDPDAVAKVAAALMFSDDFTPYHESLVRTRNMHAKDLNDLIARATATLGPHDPAPREFEHAQLTFEYLMDYGALREFRRHRIQTLLPQYLTIRHGYSIPPLVQEAGLADTFTQAIDHAQEAFLYIERTNPPLAQYLVTHAHNQRVLSTMNARECWHLFKLRTSELAHFAIREPVTQAMHQAVDAHPALFQHLQLKSYPNWWPFLTE